MCNFVLTFTFYTHWTNQLNIYRKTHCFYLDVISAIHVFALNFFFFIVVIILFHSVHVNPGL